MADLLLRNIDDELARALEEQAVAHGRSAEAEHRSILEAALGLRERPGFLEVLASIPDVGTDADFERIQSTTAAKSHVFD